MLEAMQERSVTVDGTTHPLSTVFSVFATQNPVEFEGTYPLPEAELDRFLVKTLVAYPDDPAEQGILRRVLEGFDAAEPASYGIEQALDRDGLVALQRAVRRVRVEPSLLAYVTGIVRATRDAPALTLGGSPRASVALLVVAQASALLDGREYVVPDDVKTMARPVLRHRVTLAPELELEGVTADAAIQSLIERVDVPRG
jgi:MoxR-like ATPase